MNCDGCMACCKALPIDDEILVKESDTLCRFCDKGCQIYDDRPQSCVNFNCLYIQEGDDESLRPDNTGVIFDKLTTKIYSALVMEDRLDTWETIQVSRFIKTLNDRGISVVVSCFSQGIIDIKCTPAHDINKVLQLALSMKG